ncbi:DUF473 domain-containing protein [Methanothermococcus okinawensis]|uniref:Uncharacterized protein n=1 Tax=Methanothermococcus okinawensis (strain DSM 14208 / JCM 11175 / IH1) TaxID=647113 RepID=F8ALU4_METOI|nr:DUF473 domain-containing protein [Methanothermococcus okinawensis]AEH07395.1 protein of unknown function DUF473 [Methanothermococcus okinawensis IH1]
MEITALTGISPTNISGLVKNHVKTFNLKNFSNILALTSLDIGDYVFITDVSKEDIIPGTEGIVAQIKKLSICSQKENPMYFEEIDTVVAKVQFEVVGYGICIDAVNNDVLNPTMVVVKIKSIYG